jgi:hypothetical protein
MAHNSDPPAADESRSGELLDSSVAGAIWNVRSLPGIVRNMVRRLLREIPAEAETTSTETKIAAFSEEVIEGCAAAGVKMLSERLPAAITTAIDDEINRAIVEALRTVKPDSREVTRLLRRRRDAIRVLRPQFGGEPSRPLSSEQPPPEDFDEVDRINRAVEAAKADRRRNKRPTRGTKNDLLETLGMDEKKFMNKQARVRAWRRKYPNK